MCLKEHALNLIESGEEFSVIRTNCLFRIEKKTMFC